MQTKLCIAYYHIFSFFYIFLYRIAYVVSELNVATPVLSVIRCAHPKFNLCNWKYITFVMPVLKLNNQLIILIPSVVPYDSNVEHY